MFFVTTLISFLIIFRRSWLPDSWVAVPSCQNLTETSCNLVEVFPSYDHIYLDLQVNVHAQNKNGDRGPPVNVTFNPMMDGKLDHIDCLFTLKCLHAVCIDYCIYVYLFIFSVALFFGHF